MNRLIPFLLVVALLIGCKALQKEVKPKLPPFPTVSTNRAERMALRLAAPPAPAPEPTTEAFTTPGTPAFTSITATGEGVTLSWNAPGVFTLSGGPSMQGPWSAITNSSSPVTIQNLGSNAWYYRLSQNPLKVERYPVGGNDSRVWFTLCGDNNVVLAISDAHWSEQDYLLSITNGVMTGFPLETAGMPPCAPFAADVDVPGKRFFTLEGGCYYGATTGPYVVREWQLFGQEGFFTNAIQLNSHTDGTFGDSWGDLIRLKSGALVWCRKTQTGYCWSYRSPAGQWQPPLCRSDIPMGPTIMVLGQHPDETIYSAITRDTYHTFALVAMKEQAGQLAFSSLHHIPCEGEWPEPSIVPDHANNRLIVSRNIDPYFPWQWGEAWGTIKGSDMQAAFVYSENSILQSTHLPLSSSADPGGKTENAQNMSECVNPHAAVMAHGKLWLIRQEFNPRQWRFNLVYATPWEGDRWGERIFLYESPSCASCRGLAHNWLQGYRNSDPNPKRLVFTNVDENGEASIFELSP